MVIGLKYKTYYATSPASPITSSPMFFDALISDYRTTTERDSGRTMRGIDYSHIKVKKGYYDIIISADELTNATKYSFINEFYQADNHYLSTENTIASPIWKDVVLTNSGDIPIENIEGSKFLPEIKLKLIEKAAR